MKKIILAAAVGLILCAIIFVVIFNINTNKKTKDSEKPLSSETLSINYVEPIEQSLKDIVNKSDTIINAFVIQIETSDNGFIYTLQINDVYKGLNLTGIGYLHAKDDLTLNENYLLFLKNDQTKYHYLSLEDSYYAFLSNNNETFNYNNKIDNINFINNNFTLNNLKEEIKEGTKY